MEAPEQPLPTSTNVFRTLFSPSLLLFDFVTPLVRFGSRSEIQLQHTMSLGADVQTQRVYSDVRRRLRQPAQKLWMALAAVAGWDFAAAGMLGLVADAMALLTPFIVGRIVSCFSSGRVEATFVYIVVLFAASCCHALALQHFINGSFIAGAKVTSAATSLVMNACLHLRQCSQHGDWEGKVTNVFVKDAQSLREFVVFARNIVAAPILVVGTVCMLFLVIGPAAFAGVAAVLLLMPLERLITQKSKHLRKQVLHLSDSRMAQVYNMIDGIRTVKLENLVDTMHTKVQEARKAELKAITHASLVAVANRALMAAAPVIVAAVTFMAHVLLFNAESADNSGNQSNWWTTPPLTADRAVTAIAYLSTLAHPFKVFPKAIQLLVDASVSIKRMEALLSEAAQTKNSSNDGIFELDDIHSNQSLHHREDHRGEDFEVRLEACQFSRSSSGPATLTVDAVFGKGLNLVTGSTASGKSTLLLGIMGELPPGNGRVVRPHDERIAYCSSDKPWIVNGTAQANVLLGTMQREIDEARFHDSVRACGLDVDFGTWEDGEHTIIGEKGITLSGGQQARICLARAMYSSCPVVVLDAPLASVDSVVAMHVFQHAILRLSRERCVIMATHNRGFLDAATKLFYVDEGTLRCAGSLNGLPAVVRAQAISEVDTVAEARTNTSDGGSAMLKRPCHQPESSDKVAKTVNNADDRWVRSFAVGGRRRVFTEYLRANGIAMAVVACILAVTGQVMVVAKDAILTDKAHSFDEGSEGFLRTYLLLSMLTVATMFAKGFVFMWAGLRASGLMHSRLLTSVLNAPLQFFREIASGKVASRFSADMDTIDFQLPENIASAMESFLAIFTGVGVAVYSMPALLLCFVPLGMLFAHMQDQYRRPSMDLKKMDSALKGPIFSCLRETIDGLEYIRAFQIGPELIRKHYQVMDNEVRARLNWDALNRWLGIRLDMIGALMIALTAFALAFKVFSGSLTSGQAGLALAFALASTKSLSFAVRIAAALEVAFVAPERVLQYTNLLQERDVLTAHHHDRDASDNETPLLQPHEHPEEDIEMTRTRYESDLVVQHLTVSYTPELPSVVHNVSFAIRPGQVVGICGRTGSGKSSLAMALLNAVHIQSGTVHVCGRDVTHTPVSELRELVQVFPQDAFLFAGTVREVIDPWHSSSLPKLHEIADRLLQPFMRESREGADSTALAALLGHSSHALMEFKIEKAGANVSGGQRQLLNLARVGLSTGHVIVLDECCSQMDAANAANALSWVKKLLRERQATTMIIAHRLDDIADCDLVLVMDGGRVVEQGTPAQLLLQQGSQFGQMVQQMGQDACNRVLQIAQLQQSGGPARST